MNTLEENAKHIGGFEYFQKAAVTMFWYLEHLINFIFEEIPQT